MKEDCPSRTALRVAMRRAAHQVLDNPRIFDDPLAWRVLGKGQGATVPDALAPAEDTPFERVMRASLVARSRYAEDALQAAVERGVRQYVILGAGLDTFAYRHPHPPAALRVFEVDHPATQAWKRRRLEDAGIPIPGSLTFAAADFETVALADGLRRAGFDTDQRSFFSWLGLTMYLTEATVTATLRYIAALPAGSATVFDYLIAPTLLNPAARRAFDGLAQRVALAGEPFQTYFDPSVLPSNLNSMGFGDVVDLGSEQLNALYCVGRTDGLRVGSLAHVVEARV